MRSTWSVRLLAGVAICAAAQATASLAFAQEINLYTTREAGLMKPLIDEFTKATGVKVNTIFMERGLPERVAAEGDKSPADVLMAVDAGNLMEMVDKGVTQPIGSAALDAAVPRHLRDENGQWVALSMRARLVYASKDDVKQTAVTYEELADPKWKGKVCIRSGQHPYNTSLIAAYIAKYGEAKAEEWLRGVKANLARKPAGGDREIARDILAGLCTIGPGNSYYVGLMRSGKGGPDQKKWGDGVNVILPTFAGGGTHVNVSGAAIAKYAPNKANAVKFLEFLASEPAQRVYAEANYEYPVRASVSSDPIIDALGQLKPDETPLTAWLKHRAAASRLVERVGFDG